MFGVVCIVTHTHTLFEHIFHPVTHFPATFPQCLLYLKMLWTFAYIEWPDQKHSFLIVLLNYIRLSTGKCTHQSYMTRFHEIHWIYQNEISCFTDHYDMSSRNWFFFSFVCYFLCEAINCVVKHLSAIFGMKWKISFSRKPDDIMLPFFYVFHCEPINTNINLLHVNSKRTEHWKWFMCALHWFGVQQNQDLELLDFNTGIMQQHHEFVTQNV